MIETRVDPSTGGRAAKLENRRDLLRGRAHSVASQPALSSLPELPKASLIICSRNRPELLVETIESILKGQCLPAELIVVDQSDRENAAVAATSSPACEVRYLWQPGRGVSRARNAGAMAARYPILVYTDDDMEVHPHWFSAIVAALVSEGATSVISGRVLAMPGASEASTPSLKTSEERAVYQGRIGRDVLWTNNMAIYREAFLAADGFDERLGPGTPFPSSEDNDLGYRLLESDFRIVYEPRAVLFHRDWRSPRELRALQWSYGVGQGAFYAKYADLRDRFMLVVALADFRAQLRGFPRILRHPRILANRAIYVMGILYGAAGWTLRGRERLHG